MIVMRMQCKEWSRKHCVGCHHVLQGNTEQILMDTAAIMDISNVLGNGIGNRVISEYFWIACDLRNHP